MNDQEIEAESLRRRKTCNCGYNPFSERPVNRDHCSVNLALQNHVTFPSFELMTDLSEPSMLYYKENSRRNLEPQRHWASLLDIQEVMQFPKFISLTWNIYGESIMVAFYPENGDRPSTFNWSDIKLGHTLCILYPEKKTFSAINPDIEPGIIVVNLDSCFVFNAPLNLVHEEAQKLLRNADLETNQMLECFTCGTRKENLSQCGSCKLAKYCSKECQMTSWKTGHKKLCSQSEILLKLSCLHRHSFESGNYFTFNSQKSSSTQPNQRYQLATVNTKTNTELNMDLVPQRIPKNQPSKNISKLKVQTVKLQLNNQNQTSTINNQIVNTVLNIDSVLPQSSTLTNVNENVQPNSSILASKNIVQPIVETKEIKLNNLTTDQQSCDATALSSLLHTSSLLSDDSKLNESQLKKPLDSVATNVNKKGDFEPECPICIETYSSLKESKIRLMSTYCGHIICKPCMEDLFKNMNEKVFCPVCRKLLNKKKCHDIFI